MAQLPAQFDASEVEPRHPNEVRPAGWYACYPSASVMKPAKSGGADYLEIEFTVYEPSEFAGSKFYDRLNVEHDNPVVQEIAYRTLSSICHATGVLVITDTEELHDQPLAIRVSVTPGETGDDGKEYGPKNEIRDYRAVDEVEIGITAPLAMAEPVEAKEQKAKPAAKAAPTATAKPWEKKATTPTKPAPKAASKPAPTKSKPVVEEEEAEEEEEEVVEKTPAKATPPWAKKK